MYGLAELISEGRADDIDKESTFMVKKIHNGWLVKRLSWKSETQMIHVDDINLLPSLILEVIFKEKKDVAK